MTGRRRGHRRGRRTRGGGGGDRAGGAGVRGRAPCTPRGSGRVSRSPPRSNPAARARARARDPRGAPRGMPSPSWTKARRRAPRRPAEAKASPGRPRPRRDEMRSDGYGVGGARRAMRWLARVRLVRLEARRPNGRGALCARAARRCCRLARARGWKRGRTTRGAQQIDELRTRRFITFHDTSSPKALLRSIVTAFSKCKSVRLDVHT